MAQIIINIPQNEANNLMESYAKDYHYDREKKENETKAEFAKRMIIGELKIHLLNYKYYLLNETIESDKSDVLNGVDDLDMN